MVLAGTLEELETFHNVIGANVEKYVFSEHKNKVFKMILGDR